MVLIAFALPCCSPVPVHFLETITGSSFSPPVVAAVPMLGAEGRAGNGLQCLLDICYFQLFCWHLRHE